MRNSAPRKDPIGKRAVLPRSGRASSGGWAGWARPFVREVAVLRRLQFTVAAVSIAASSLPPDIPGGRFREFSQACPGGVFDGYRELQRGGRGLRAAIIQADGAEPLPVAAGAFDRFLAVYVLDLLGPGEATAIVAEARRLLRPGGLLAAASLTPGATTPAPLMSRAWTAVWSLARLTRA